MLISASVRTNDLANFFIGIAKTQPIFQVESAAMILDDSRVEKRFILLLVKLAKANVIAVEARQSSVELAQEVRQRLMRLVEDQRYVFKASVPAELSVTLGWVEKVWRSFQKRASYAQSPYPACSSEEERVSYLSILPRRSTS